MYNNSLLLTGHSKLPTEKCLWGWVLPVRLHIILFIDAINVEEIKYDSVTVSSL